MREHGTDYFQNSRNATYVHREYAIRNPLEFAGYEEFYWGITATDGPNWEKRTVNGIERNSTTITPAGRPMAPMIAQLTLEPHRPGGDLGARESRMDEVAAGNWMGVLLSNGAAGKPKGVTDT
jgi:hypothetical protein